MTADIITGDALTVLRGMEAGSVDLVAVDPPYYRVKSEAWDRQWDTPAGFLAWIGDLCVEWERVLKPNGSLYCFASPQMAARVECKIGETFNVLNRITWRKPPFSTKAEMFDKETCRAFLPASEAILFAEQVGSDVYADDASGFTSACESGKRSVFGAYMAAEITRAGRTRREIAALFPSATGNLTGCVSNWLIGYNCPTREQYHSIREFLNGSDGSEYLRREYEDLRREYEDLRRPFNVTSEVPYTDVWDFATVGTYDGKHVCEKPLPLMRHIITASTRPGATVLDCCMGSGSTGVACLQTGRHFIGVDISEHWCNVARSRCAAVTEQAALIDVEYTVPAVRTRRRIADAQPGLGL